MREGRHPKPKGSTFADARALGLVPGCGEGAEDRVTPRPPPPTAFGRAPPPLPQGPPSLRLPEWHSALLQSQPRAEGIPLCCAKKPWLTTLTDPRVKPIFRRPPHMGGHDCVLHRKPAEIGRWSRHHRVRESGEWPPRAPMRPLPGCVLTDVVPKPLGFDPVPRRPPVLAIQEEPARAIAGVVPWDLPPGIFGKGDTEGTATASILVDVYFSAGVRHRWTENHLDRRSYASCDDGNDRACSIWRVRVNLGGRIGAAERVYPASDPGLGTGFDRTYTQPAVSPDGRWLAFNSFYYETYDPFEMVGDNYIEAARRDATTGKIGTPAVLLEPPDYMRGLIGSAAWMGNDDLFSANGKSVRAGQLGSTLRSTLAEDSAGGLLARSTWPVRGANLLAAFSASLGVRDLSGIEGHMATWYTDATDPHAHLYVNYNGENRGARVVAFGQGGEELPVADRHEGKSVSRVFDPSDIEVLGPNSFETPELPTWNRTTMGGCHHPTWNPSGDLFQCSHQESLFHEPKGRGIRALHGFRWLDGAWRTWDGNAGFLFPRTPTGYRSTEDWWDDLPNALQAAWPGLVDLVDPADWSNANLIFIWKYGYFCGNDEWVVAQFALYDEEWALNEWGVKRGASGWEVFGRLGQKLSRIVLINLATGEHRDLTSKVAEALGINETAGGYLDNVAGVYPTASEPIRGVPRWAGGMVVHRSGSAFGLS